MTYSIVARDEATGEMGVAVQTCMFAVGSLASWARAGVGAVATQSIADPAYGPRCLELMASGADAGDALRDVRSGDPGSLLRQVGVVDARGGVTRSPANSASITRGTTRATVTPSKRT